MKDQVFGGEDVNQAVRAACQALGVPEAQLRYVVLQRETSGGRGLSATPARIAVLMDALQTRASASSVPAAPAPAAPAPAEGRASAMRSEERVVPSAHPVQKRPEAAPAIRAVIRELADAAGVELSVEVEPEGTKGLVVRLACAEPAFMDEALLSALSHVFSKAAQDGEPRHVSLEFAGRRHGKDEDLRRQATDIARQVRSDGQARSLPPMSSYDRRLVHMVLSGEPGVRTESAGQGPERHIQVLPRPLDEVGGPELM